MSDVGIYVEFLHVTICVHCTCMFFCLFVMYTSMGLQLQVAPVTQSPSVVEQQCDAVSSTDAPVDNLPVTVAEHSQATAAVEQEDIAMEDDATVSQTGTADGVVVSADPTPDKGVGPLNW